MKIQKYTIIWHNPLPQLTGTDTLTRDRAAYLLRAARSRRRHNITPTGDRRYWVRDSNVILSPVL